MPLPHDAALLRIFLGEAEHADGRPLFEAVIVEARSAGLAGATALRGPLGFGRSSSLHSAKILALSEDLPVVIEIVDTPERIDAFLPRLDALLDGRGLVTLERVQVLRGGRE